MVHSVARLYTDQCFLSLSHRRHVARLLMLCRFFSNENHCLFFEPLSLSITVRHTLAAVAAHPLELESLKCRGEEHQNL